MNPPPATPEALDLFLQGTLALAKVEHSGLKIDTTFLDTKIQETEKTIKELSFKLREDKVFKLWKKTYGERANLGSREQLGEILFGKMGLQGSYTRKSEEDGAKKKRWKTEESVFEEIDLPFVKDWVRVEKLKKIRGTFLEGIRKETVNGFLHPSFDLNTVRTYRSSSSNPNFTNLPIRDPEFAEIIRSCFIPRKGRVLLEIDFGALEFRGAACKWRDPAMVKYASDPNKDIHRDSAAKVFKCKKAEVGKQERYVAKNQFVFPQLYGSYYIQCAKNIWESCDKLNLKVNDVPMKSHLDNKGIHSLGKCNPKESPEEGTFEKHVQKVEKDFNETFHVYKDAKEKWWNDYLKRGWFQMMTGFVVQGLHSRNDLMNYDIQGSCFHCLLWSLIQLQKWIEKKKLRCKIVGQIHDCIVLDCPENEVQEVLSKAHQIMTTELQKAWSWVIVPMLVEIDVAETNWYLKKPWDCVNGTWIPRVKEEPKRNEATDETRGNRRDDRKQLLKGLI